MPGFLLLQLDDGNFQSLMRKSRPYRLELGYTRTLMGFLLFNPDPGHIVMIGLGGGSLPKYCHRNLRQSRISVVEINPDVIALRDLFHVPADSERFRVYCEDGAEFVGRQQGCVDVLVVDGFDRGGQVPQLCTQDFYENCWTSLSEAGVLAINVLGADACLPDYMERLRQRFGQVFTVPSEDCENRILFVVKHPRTVPTRAELDARVCLLDKLHGFRFGHIANSLRPQLAEIV